MMSGAWKINKKSQKPPITFSGNCASESLRPYTPMRGALSTVWFDRWKISNECPEHIETIDSMCRVLTNVIDDEVKNGISKNKIILGGFSMGGGMAMHLAYRYHQDVAGVFALSSFLNKTSAVYQGEDIWVEGGGEQARTRLLFGYTYYLTPGPHGLVPVLIPPSAYHNGILVCGWSSWRYDLQVRSANYTIASIVWVPVNLRPFQSSSPYHPLIFEILKTHFCCDAKRIQPANDGYGDERQSDALPKGSDPEESFYWWVKV
ncbi:unnamed protein product [Caretta caretta]